jgi:peroxiredoxin/uncharacterized protein YneF (UPF0154 family)
MAENLKEKGETRLETLLLLLMGIVILLMAAIIGLFIRMNQVHKEVMAAAAPLKAMAQAQAEMIEQMTGRGQDTGLDIGVQAPPFVLTDTVGSVVSLDDYTGQSVLLVFSSTHCKGCSEMYPELAKFNQGQQGIRIVMISVGVVEDVRQLAKVHGFAFSVLPVPDWNHEVMRDYQVNGVPFFYVIDTKGTVVGAGFAHNQEQITALVRQAGRHRTE